MFSPQVVELPNPDSITTPVLQEFGFIINTQHRIVICIDCKSAVDPRNLRQHVVTNHKSLKPQKDLQAQFDSQVPADINLASFPIPSPAATVPVIYGLIEPKSDYLICVKCNHGYGETRTFKAHSCYKKDPSTASVTGLVQRYSGNSQHSWFPVTRRETSSEQPLTPWQAFQNQIQSAPTRSTEASNTENYRVFRQILHKERWIEHIHGKDLAQLKELISFSVKKEPLGCLVRHIHAYLADIQCQLRDKYVRRLIGTRPTTEHEHTFSRHHSDVGWDTHRKYAYVLAGALYLLINNIIAPSEHYSFSVPSEIADAAKRLFDVLKEGLTDEDSDEDDDEEDEEEEEEEEVAEEGSTPYAPSEIRPPPKTTAAIQTTLRKLLLLLFRQQAVANDSFFSIFIRYIVLASVNIKGDWLSAGMITQKIASILFVGRLVFADALLTMKRNDPSMTTAK